jgi:hypothetical protein
VKTKYRPSGMRITVVTTNPRRSCATG